MSQRGAGGIKVPDPAPVPGTLETPEASGYFEAALHTQAWLPLASPSDISSEKDRSHAGAAPQMGRHPTGILMPLQLEDYVAAAFSATRPTPAPLPERVTQGPDFTPLLGFLVWKRVLFLVAEGTWSFPFPDLSISA